MPAGLDQHDRAAGLQTGVGDRLVPTLECPPLDRAVSLRVALDRVVDEQEIRAAAGNRTACTDRVIGAAAHEVEPMGRRAIRREFAGWEYGRFERVSDEVSDASAEVEREFSPVARRYHGPIGMPA